MELIVRGQRVVTPHGVQAASVRIRDGVIAEVSPHSEAPGSAVVIDVGSDVVMPGVIDTHVHVNEPGRTAWEGFRSATRAAAAGGITTIVDMPLNCVPATTTVASIAVKRAAAEGQCWIDVGLWGGVVPGNCDQLLPMIDAGVRGFKCFLTPSGVDEFEHVGEATLVPAMERLADAQVPLLVHAELPGPIEAAVAALGDASPQSYASYLRTRPRAAEDLAVALMIRLCRQSRAAVHIVHHSSADSLALLEAARGEGLPISAETTTHYLHFAAEDIGAGATAFKCAPPIRERENRERLWTGLASGVLDMVVSDHSPCTPALKGLDSGDFLAAWGGIASLQLTLPITWSDASRRGHSLEDIARWMCSAPARLAGLSASKGVIAPGYDADLVVWDPDSAFEVEGGELEHRHPLTPYQGERLCGRVKRTFLRGQTVYDRGHFSATPLGRML